MYYEIMVYKNKIPTT